MTSKDELLKLLENGIESAQGLQFGGWKWAKATYAFTSDDDEANEANRQFAKMMHVKTQYDGPPPTLTLGTILCAEFTYWICLQPKCDSVRIYGPTAFPMLPMTTVTDEQDLKDAALALEGVIKQHAGVVEWQSNPDVQRLMRRDIKRELRPSGDYGEPQLDELANRIVELAQHRRGC